MKSKIYNVLVMVQTSTGVQVLWLDNDNKFSKDRENSKILLDDESKELLSDLRGSNEYVMVGRFPADLDWKTDDGRVLVCPTKNKLESLLKKYLEVEDYESACIVRDKLKVLYS